MFRYFMIKLLKARNEIIVWLLIILHMANVCRKRYKKWKNIGNYIENGPSYRFKSWDMLSKTIFLVSDI